MVTIISGVATHVGRVRELNEDTFSAGDHLFVVADGMGGHAAGEIASALAIARLEHLGDKESLKPEDIVQAVESANNDILASAAENIERARMGTTITGLGLVRVGGTDHWAVFNVGDSRVYRFADAALTQLTTDHSEVEELVASGRLRAEDARTHPLRNVVTRSLGTAPGPVTDVWLLPLAKGERFVVCSDGLYTELGDDEIAATLAREPDVQRAADALVEEAVSAGGRDNVTVIVVDFAGAHALDDAAENTAPRPRDPEAT
jgi:serine/threonine protein phosphatase PrpC